MSNLTDIHKGLLFLHGHVAAPTCTRRMPSPPPTRALSRSAIEPPPAGRSGGPGSPTSPPPPSTRRNWTAAAAAPSAASAGLARHATSRQLCGDQASLGFGLSSLLRRGLVVDKVDTSGDGIEGLDSTGRVRVRLM